MVFEEAVALAVNKAKKINLDDYGITNALGGLFQTGGGEVRVDDVGDFWAINTEGPLVVSVTFFGMFKIITSNVTIVRTVGEDLLAQVCFGFDIAFNGDVYRGFVMITGEDTSAYLRLNLDVV